MQKPNCCWSNRSIPYKFWIAIFSSSSSYIKPELLKPAYQAFISGRQPRKLYQLIKSSTILFHSLDTPPPTIETWLYEVDLIAKVRTIFGIPQIICDRIKVNAKTIANPISIIQFHRVSTSQDIGDRFSILSYFQYSTCTIW